MIIIERVNIFIAESPSMVDHYPDEQMPEPEVSERPPEYDTEQDPDRCKVKLISCKKSLFFVVKVFFLFILHCTFKQHY